MHFLTFIRQRHSILHQTEASSATWSNYFNQSEATSLMTSVLRRYMAEYTNANSWRYPIRHRVTFAGALELLIFTRITYAIRNKRRLYLINVILTLLMARQPGYFILQYRVRSSDYDSYVFLKASMVTWYLERRRFQWQKDTLHFGRNNAFPYTPIQKHITKTNVYNVRPIFD